MLFLRMPIFEEKFPIFQKNSAFFLVKNSLSQALHGLILFRLYLLAEVGYFAKGAVHKRHYGGGGSSFVEVQSFYCSEVIVAKSLRFFENYGVSYTDKAGGEVEVVRFFSGKKEGSIFGDFLSTSVVDGS